MKDYNINDPWDWVTRFEDEVANYTGYRYGIACDSNSNAIRLVIRPETATREMSLSVGNATMLAIERTDASKNGIHPMRTN